MKVYENVYIGNFIYACGRISAGHDLLNSGSVNLYQQTPHDKTIGDLMVSGGFKCVIIEFKKDLKDIETEKNKSARLNLFNVLLHQNKYPNMLDTSLLAHYISYPESFQLLFWPYIDFFKPDSKYGKIEMNNFIHLLYSSHPTASFEIEKRLTIGVDYNSLHSYINFLRDLDPNPASSGIGGLVFCINAEKKVMFLPFENIIELCKMMESPFIQITSTQEVEDTRINTAKKIQEAAQKQVQINMGN